MLPNIHMLQVSGAKGQNKADLPAPDNHHKATQTSSTFIWMTATWNSALDTLHGHKQTKKLTKLSLWRLLLVGGKRGADDVRTRRLLIKVIWGDLQVSVLNVWCGKNRLFLDKMRWINCDIYFCSFIFLSLKDIYDERNAFVSIQNALVLRYRKHESEHES